ncbi:DUF4190 domain-containing protein [Nocardiopsis algeriensis]|uniref:DUF4190 domain-containing protein n=1 Tax=Nocardiopsis algeriensis TaxID=1478215 RepID=A0A841IRM9_9ACTN|nr:DUF4190 domain-containing protein [Nocardiopsis algeriensis]MBB6118941.1 hypothetical protein [Nocardiopsis algeriensis]
MTDNHPDPRSQEEPPRIERGGLWGLFLGLAGLLLPPYGVVLSAFGLVQGARARRAARQNRSEAPLALMSMAVGVAGLVVSVAMLAVVMVFQEQLLEYRDCSALAHTVTSQKACDEAWLEGTAVPTWAVGS